MKARSYAGLAPVLVLSRAAGRVLGFAQLFGQSNIGPAEGPVTQGAWSKRAFQRTIFLPKRAGVGRSARLALGGRGFSSDGD